MKQPTLQLPPGLEANIKQYADYLNRMTMIMQRLANFNIEAMTPEDAKIALEQFRREARETIVKGGGKVKISL